MKGFMFFKKWKRSGAALLVVSLVLSLLPWTAGAGRANAQSLSAAIGQNIVDWRLDEQNGYIYAITDDTDKLLFIDADTLQIQKEIVLGANPSDLELADGKLYIPLSLATKVKVIDLATQEIASDVSTGDSRLPYKVAVDNGKLYYVTQNNTSFVYAINLLAVPQTEAQLDVYPNNYDVADLAVDREKHVLYVGESGSTGSNLYAYSTLTDLRLTDRTTYDENYGFSFPERKVILDGNSVFYAGRKFPLVNPDDSVNQLAVIDGDYQDEGYSYPAKIQFVQGSSVFTEKAVYDRNTFVKVFELPFETKLVLKSASGKVYLFKASDKSIQTFDYQEKAPSAGVYSIADNKLSLNSTVTDLIYGEQTGVLYAISKSANKLLYIDPNTLQVVHEIYIGSKPTDLDLFDGRLYVALSGSTQIAVTDAVYHDAQAVDLYTVDQNPYRIEPSAGKIYYVADDQHQKLRVYDRNTQLSGPIDNRTFYQPDLLLDEPNGLIYIGESAISGGDLTALRLSDYTQAAVTNYDNSYGFPYPIRKVFKDGTHLFYAKHRISETADLSGKLSDILAYGEEIQYVKGNDVFTEHSVFDKATGTERFKLPFTLNQAVVTDGGKVFLYSSAKNGIYRYESVDEIKIPRAVAQNAGFTDTDPDEGQIAGTLTWTKDSDESYITGYRAYFLNDSGEKLNSAALAGDTKTTDPYSKTVTENTYIPAGATKIGLFSYNAYAESVKYAAVPIVDYIIRNEFHLDGKQQGYKVKPNDAIVTIRPEADGGSILRVHLTDDDLNTDTGNQSIVLPEALAPSDFVLARVDNNDPIPVTVTDATYASKGAFDLKLGAPLSSNVRYKLSLSSTAGGNELALPPLPLASGFASVALLNDEGTTVFEHIFHPVTVVASQDLTAPKTPSVKSAVAGDRSVSLNWIKNEEADLAGYRFYINGKWYRNLEKNYTSFSLQGSPFINGTEYTIGLSAYDTNGNESARAEFKLTPTAASVVYVTTVTSNTSALIVSKTETLPDGRIVTVISIDPAKLLESLTGLKNQAVQTLSIPVAGTSGSFKIDLPASALLEASKQVPNAVIVIESAEVKYRLPVSLVDISALANRLGTDPANLKISVSVDKLAGATVEGLQTTAGGSGLKIVSGVYEFKLTVSANGKTEELNNFGSTYVTRSITVSGTIDPRRTTAVWYNPVTGTFSFVPAFFTTAGGTTQADLLRNGNSIYTLVESKKSFDDLKTHWAKDDVELLASKLIVNGMSDQEYRPELAVTRAQLAALLVRSLGLTPAAFKAKFSDVGKSDWFGDAVTTAAENGLISGYEDGTFRPDQPVSRQEMAVMIANAMKFAGYKTGVSSEEIKKVSSVFKDASDLGEWALPAVAFAVKEKMLDGFEDGTFAPSGGAERAQSAAVLARMLKTLKFIN